MGPEAPVAPTSALIYLSGERRGTTELLRDSTDLGIQDGKAIARVAEDGTPPGSGVAARLHRRADGYDLEARSGHEIWINGKPVAARRLESGDVVEIGRKGPMLRYCAFADGVIPRRTVSDVVTDCVDCARFEQGRIGRKTGLLVGGITHEFLVRTTLRFRIVVALALVSIFVMMIYLLQQNRELERRIAEGEVQVGALAELIERTESWAIGREDLLEVRRELEGNISTAVQRVEALETLSGAGRRVVLNASQSVLFIQGSYGFEHAASGRRLRYQESAAAEGDAVLPGGRGATLAGDGPVVELPYTGTGFVATEGRLIITSRHLAQPWVGKDIAAIASLMGLTPYQQRLIGYLPDMAEPVELSVVKLSEEADVSVLRALGDETGLKPLPVRSVTPRPGDEVIVLGYPAGMRAMLARTDQEFLNELQESGELDFWDLGQMLAASGHIQPLATRGIIGQVTESAVVYDAQTAQGGSGAPVLTLDGAVVAVNTAILNEFGGSNLGVPIDHVVRMLGDSPVDY